MTSTASTRQSVGILIFDDVEVLDFCGPFEVFSVAGLNGSDDSHLFDVWTVAEEVRTITCRGGLLVTPHWTLADHPPLDLIVLPGGYGTRKEMNNPVVLDWIARHVASQTLVTTVCTGAVLLAQTGALDHRRATTHWEVIDRFREGYPAIEVVDDERVIDIGPIVTSAGVSAGIDMSLHVVARLHGIDVARKTARAMEYDWS